MPLKLKKLEEKKSKLAPNVSDMHPIETGTPRPKIKINIEKAVKNLDPENKKIFREIQRIIGEKKGLEKVGTWLLDRFLKKHPKQLGILRDLLKLAKKSRSPRIFMMALEKGMDFLRTIRKAKNVELKLMKAFLQLNKDPKLKSLTLEERMNVAYGRLILGTKNAEKLRTKRGITYFMRYSPQQLESQMYQVDRTYKPKHTSIDELRLQQARPTVLVVFNKHDYSGSFYFQSESFRELSKKFKVVIHETDNEQGFYDAVRKTHTKHKPITHLIIGGHGKPGSISLGRVEVEKGVEERGAEKKTLDLTDERELKRLQKYLRGTRVILRSCSTGKKVDSRKNMQTMIKRALGVSRVFAPTEDSGGGQSIYKTKIVNGIQTIVDVDYLLRSEIPYKIGDDTKENEQNKTISDMAK